MVEVSNKMSDFPDSDGLFKASDLTNNARSVASVMKRHIFRLAWNCIRRVIYYLFVCSNVEL